MLSFRCRQLWSAHPSDNWALVMLSIKDLGCLCPEIKFLEMTENTDVLYVVIETLSFFSVTCLFVITVINVHVLVCFLLVCGLL